MHFRPSLTRQLARGNAGVAAIEFALVLPLLIILFVGMVEISRYIILNQKLDKITYAMADFVTQNAQICVSDLDNDANAVPELLQPFVFDGTVIFSSVANFTTPTPTCPDANTPCIVWQHSELGGGASRLGGVGSNPQLPNNYAVAPGQDIIVVETFHHYIPVLDISSQIIWGLGAQDLYKVAIYKPRQGDLITLCPN